MAMTKVKNLQMWCKKMCEGYRDVEVLNMAASWKSGLAFCAIIHRFRPDLIDYDSLSKENVFENNQLAFETAEKQLSIPAFLEAADMVAIRVPDKLSVVTYVSQYYNYFHNKPQLGGPGVKKATTPAGGVKKTQEAVTPNTKKLTPAQQNVGKPLANKERQESIGDKCTICHERVYLLERQIENSKLYHRSCFRGTEMSPTTKVFKRGSVMDKGEDKSIHSKARKLDTDRVADKTTPRSTEPEPNFWQRRAQLKGDNSADKPVTQNGTGNVSNGQDQGTNSVPSWQKPRSAALDKKTANEPVRSKETDLPSAGFLSHTKTEKADKPSSLANKFKELNERNLNQTFEVKKPTTANDQKKDEHKAPGAFSGVQLKKTFELDKKESKEEKKPAFTPVARPRQQFRKEEKMDTSESTKDLPKATPRQTKQEPVLDSSKNTKQPRSKTPPLKHKAEFSLQNISPRREKFPERAPAGGPPPLPVSSPPRLPASAPPKVETHTKISPREPPSSFPSNKTTHTKQATEPTKPTVGSSAALSKPSRVSQNVETKHSGSPMEVELAPGHAVVHDPITEHRAVLVVPKTRHNLEQDSKDKAVLGGLLKSLAQVRTKQETKDTAPTGSGDGVGASKPPDSSSATRQPGKAGDSRSPRLDRNKGVAFKDNKTVDSKAAASSDKTKGVAFMEKTADSKENDGKPVKGKPPRPKSSFVSGTASLFAGGADHKQESHSRDKKEDGKSQGVSQFKTKTPEPKPSAPVAPQASDDGVPAWKKQLDKRKNDRPKSADILSEKNTDTVPAWQLEAEKRKAARKGAYADPEKAKVVVGSKIKADTDVHPAPAVTSPRKGTDASDQYVPPSKFTVPPAKKAEPPAKSSEPPAKSTEPPAKPSRLGQDKDKTETPVPTKRRVLPQPPKDQPAPQPRSAMKKITLSEKFVFDEDEVVVSPKKPPRPPSSPALSLTPARPPPAQTQTSKHQMSAFDIQRQLRMIDTKLTRLELKGRQLEDSIRSAKEEEEDDLMIGWFRLVNEKNELVRTEADLIYMSRAQELEEEQKQIDLELREIVMKSDEVKTGEDSQQEEYLMEKLLDVINQRNNIVDSIDEDRIRYLEEDRDIEAMLKNKGFLKDNESGKVVKEKKKSLW